MSSSMKKRTTSKDVEVRPQADASGAGTLPDARTAIDRLFAVAAESFENMTEGDSQKFLERSRQTGGQ